MFSNDKNIETIGQLVEAIKQYIGLRGEYIKLNLVDKVVRILTIATISVIIAILLMLTLIYFSFAVAYALAHLWVTRLPLAPWLQPISSYCCCAWPTARGG